MSLVVVRKKGKVFFAYAMDDGEGMPQRPDDICSTSFLNLQAIHHGKSTYLAYYSGDLAPVEKMILRNGISDLLDKATPLSSKKIVGTLLPNLIAVFRAVGCLHTDENGKTVFFGGAFFLVGKEGIFEIDANQDVSFYPDFIGTDSGLMAYLCADKTPVDVNKAKSCIQTAAWHQFAGRRIYCPVIMGYLGDKEYQIYDWESKAHPFSEEELLCH
jgi:hypothetical protein